MTEWSHNDNAVVDQVMGAFFLIRRTLFEELDGFDERFFVYYEEVDMCYRARQIGKSSYFLREAQAYHIGCGTTEQAKMARLCHVTTSRIQYFHKHCGFCAGLSVTLIAVFLELLVRLLWCSSRLSLTCIRDVLGGYAMLFINLVAMLLGSMAALIRTTGNRLLYRRPRADSNGTHSAQEHARSVTSDDS